MVGWFLRSVVVGDGDFLGKWFLLGGAWSVVGSIIPTLFPHNETGLNEMTTRRLV